MKTAYDHRIGAKNNFTKYLGVAAGNGAKAVKKKVLGEDGHFYYVNEEILEE